MNILTAAREMALEADALRLLRDDLTVRAAVRALTDADLPAQALRLLVRLLPRGYVVPWLCQCAAGSELDETERDGLRLAEAWMRDRAEANRRAALAHAAGRHYVGAGALIAASAGWSEGFLLDADGNEVAPVAAHLMAVVAAGALLTLAMADDDFAGRCRALVAAGMPLLAPEDSP
ncbi:hypothetical protein [Luteibacter sp. 329MFSha]|uniref:DUF6931 family protein n=1 Tax=Luteibacter sp. 329MFSha TaxID=1798239 RepID=UPI0008CF3CE3|nr:hypothetical protein [Luteibacter sp. 329MFSha]SEW01617.1 hypothetical protein SAMN04515660_1805 [Luteibacter sp. 329MFSha]